MQNQFKSSRNFHSMVLCTALAVAAAMAVPSIPARAQSLPDTLVSAYLNSPELAAARANVNVSSERAVQARSGGRVQVEGLLSFEALTRSNDRNGVRYPSSAELNLLQPLYTGGQVSNTTEAAETRITSQEAVLISTEQRLLLDAATAFLDIRRDEAFVSLADNNVRVLTEQLRAARERFEVGEVTRTDVEQARARLAAAYSRQAAAEGSLSVSQETYQRVVGVYPEKLLPPPPLPDLPGSQDEAVAMALRDDPDVQAARLEREATGSDVRAAIGALLPQLSLEGRLARFDSDFSGVSADEEAAVGLFLRVPIYSGGFNYSNVREAQAVAEGASAQINDALRTAALNVGVSWAQLDVARASIRAGQLEVSAARLAFEGVQEEAKIGARTTLDVLDAEQDFLDARGALIASRRDEYVATYSVLASIGKLTIGHLGLDTGEPTGEPSYYEGVRDRYFGYDASDDTVWRMNWRP